MARGPLPFPGRPEGPRPLPGQVDLRGPQLRVSQSHLATDEGLRGGRDPSGQPEGHHEAAQWGQGGSCPFLLPGLNLLLVKRQELPKSVRIWNSPV